MTRKLALGAVVLVALALGGCDPQGGQNHDLEGVTFKDPDSAQGFNNVDGHPNIVRVCIDKVAFATTTRQGDGITRVPEWDAAFCGAVAK